MFDTDPDGNRTPIYDATAVTFEIPADKGAHLSGAFDAAWEQAAVFYVGGDPTGIQIGSYNRPTCPGV